jgi:molecular chaperone GrpE
MEELMYWKSNERPGYKIPVRRAPVGGVSPYLSRHANPFTVEQNPPAQPAPPVEQKLAQSAPPVVEEKPTTPASKETDWQAVAQRQQAEMENFRKRQTRRADEAIAAERERLLHAVLPLADNLNRALSYQNAADDKLRQGVELTLRELHRFLEAEGVTKIETAGQPFTPELHEAVAVYPSDAASDTVIQEVEAGYKLADKLLRPAKVVVAE